LNLKAIALIKGAVGHMDLLIDILKALVIALLLIGMWIAAWLWTRNIK
jgi:hypothetical protein